MSAKERRLRLRAPAVWCLEQVYRELFPAGRPKNVAVAAWRVYQLRAAHSLEEIDSVAALVAESKEKFCEAGLGVLRAEVRAARERVAREVVLPLETRVPLSVVTQEGKTA